MKHSYSWVTIPVILLGSIVATRPVSAGYLQAPPGLFKDVNDQVVGDAVILNGKQLFVDDWIIGEHHDVTKALHQPVRHPKNPLIVTD